MTYSEACRRFLERHSAKWDSPKLRSQWEKLRAVHDIAKRAGRYWEAVHKNSKSVRARIVGKAQELPEAQPFLSQAEALERVRKANFPELVTAERRERQPFEVSISPREPHDFDPDAALAQMEALDRGKAPTRSSAVGARGFRKGSR